jgi:hypothetical protein
LFEKKEVDGLRLIEMENPLKLCVFAWWRIWNEKQDQSANLFKCCRSKKIN